MGLACAQAFGGEDVHAFLDEAWGWIQVQELAVAAGGVTCFFGEFAAGGGYWFFSVVDAAGQFTLLQEQLHSVLDTLSEREAGVVSMRFGLTDGQPKTLDEIGKVYGVTRERIRQIESKTMSKLRHPSRSQVLRDYLD
jgi:hypothetical protein